MRWNVLWDPKAEKTLKKLGKPAARLILTYLHERIATGDDPRRFGEALSGDKLGLWRYRVENYRIVCRIDDHTVTVLILHVGHRKEVYKKDFS